MMLAHCPGDPLLYLLIWGIYGILVVGGLLVAWWLAWGLGGHDPTER